MRAIARPIPDEPPVTRAARSIYGLFIRRRYCRETEQSSEGAERCSPLPKKAAASAAVFVPLSRDRAHWAHRRRWLRCEVLGCPARRAAEGLRAGGGGESARRPFAGRRRGRLQARRRARPRVHGRLLSA